MKLWKHGTWDRDLLLLIVLNLMKFDKETNKTAENFLGFRYKHPYQSLRQKSSKHDRYQQQQKDNGSIPDTAEAYSCVQVLTYNSYMNIFKFLKIRPNLFNLGW